MSNIEGVQVPQDESGYGSSYKEKIENSLNALDSHDHSVGSGLPVKKISLAAVDNSSLTVTSGVISIKDGGIDESHLNTAVGGTVPPGCIIPFFHKDNSSPGSGWLRCDGASVSQATYAALYAAIGTKFGNPGGGNFNLPNLTGQFLRGVDGSAGRDPDASSRAASGSGGATGNNIGTLQKGAMKTHTHTISPDASSAWGDAGNGGNTGSYGGSEYWGQTTINYYINNSGGNEFRPKNMAVAWWIKT